MPEENKTTNILTDEEATQASGGAAFNKCPLGHYEATGFANVLSGPGNDCLNNRCGMCTVTQTGHGFEIVSNNNAASHQKECWYYGLYCNYFNRRTTRTTYEPL